LNLSALAVFAQNPRQFLTHRAHLRQMRIGHLGTGHLQPTQIHPLLELADVFQVFVTVFALIARHGIESQEQALE